MKKHCLTLKPNNPNCFSGNLCHESLQKPYGAERRTQKLCMNYVAIAADNYNQAIEYCTCKLVLGL